jgi:hypothetical protein
MDALELALARDSCGRINMGLKGTKIPVVGQAEKLS